MTKETLETFINKAKELHNNKYDYKNALWKNVGTKIKIICLIHGEFEQTPSNHLMGKECSYCAGVGRLTKEILLERIKKVHGDKYEYELGDKITNTTKIKIKCKTHGIFEQTPKNHLKGQNCPKCKCLDKNDFINQALLKHNNKYNYDNIEFINSDIKIKILCPEHGIFEQRPNDHLRGDRCYKCSNLVRTTQDFIEKANKVHNNTYSYEKTEYKKSKINIIITCKIHGNFIQKPNCHLNGKGCQKCSIAGFSKVSLRWLKYIAEKDNIFIQHHDNLGEKKIKVNNKYIRFDGFCKVTNTVYEFMGDFYHGNPDIYKPDDYNPIVKKTYGELYNDTIKRNNIITKLGYNLVTIWESDFIKFEKEKLTK
jgi:hypothetical protein